jgi:Rrf2 family transcriptional regulator, nitric oxide-sensitive transcriptional repressor
MISLTAQYAIRAVMHVAQAARWCTADEIASAANIPRGYMAKVLQTLTNAKILTSQRGLNGGFQVHPESHQATAYDIVRAIDPADRFGLCRDCRAGDPSADCAANRLLGDIQSEIDRRLRQATLTDLISACGPSPMS